MRRVLSLGAGVQSSAMLLMALEGRFGDVPDLAIFADTGWESNATRDWLERLRHMVRPFPIVTVAEGDIRADILSEGRSASMPFFLGGGGTVQRQCTSEYKVKPFRQYLRSQGITEAEVWIGFSWDERHRAKATSTRARWKNRFPLIESNLTWEDCDNFLKAKGIGSVAKSSCPGCPFHNDDHWARLRREDPEEFERACAFDDAIRHTPKLTKERYLHWSSRPLRSIREFHHEAQGRMFIDLAGGHCGGVCGL